MEGSFNQSGNPVVKVSISGALTSTPQEIEVMMDTGFSGFLMLPLTTALPLGLILFGTTEYSLADNSKTVNLACMGVITMAKKIVRGVISVANEGTPLLGMEFLRAAKLQLSVHPEGATVRFDEAV